MLRVRLAESGFSCREGRDDVRWERTVQAFLEERGIAVYDLKAVLAGLRREDSVLSGAVRQLTECISRRPQTGNDLIDELRRREEVFLRGGEETPELFRQIEALHTVYSVVIKLIAWSMVSAVREMDETAVEEILSGRAFRRAGILNYCGEDWYCHALRGGGEKTKNCLSRLAVALRAEDTIGSVETYLEQFSADSLRKIYETMIPEHLRTALGEYYTPDWLAACMVEHAVETGGKDPSTLRFLDPTCGAGTFLTAVMEWLRPSSPDGAVVGFDINPLAVLTARTNYLAAILRELPERVLIPVYCCDILHLPEERGEMLAFRLPCGFSCELPRSFCEMEVENGDFDEKRFLERLRNITGTERFSGYDDHAAPLLARLLLEQIFAFCERKADIVVGNPPWVNWETLSEEYRAQSRDLWMQYGLYNGRGKNVRFLKDDISVLITAVVLDRFLVDGGILSFVLRQAIFKSEKNGALLRRFRLGEDGAPFRVLRLDDLQKIKPFAGVNLRAALVLIRKGEEHVFPVPYYLWARKKGFLRATRTRGVSPEMIEAVTEREKTLAYPADRNDPTSLWINFPEGTGGVVDKVLGSNGYKARTGVFTGGANAVYWLNVSGKTGDGTLRVSNVTGRARRAAQQVETEMEPTHVYPLVQGHDLAPWKVQEGGYLLCPHSARSKMRPVEEQELREKTPLTYEYLCRFREELDARRGFAGWENEIRKERFYAVLRVGEYTFAKYKVAWRYIAQSFITAVIEEREDPVLGRKLPLPNEKVMYVGTENRAEAYYLCGVLSSLPVRYAVECYMNPTSISAHVLDKLSLPAFDEENPLHCTISALCEEGHRARDAEKLCAIRTALDEEAAKLYGIEAEMLAEIRTMIKQ